MAALLFASSRLQAVAAGILVLLALQVAEAAATPAPATTSVRMAIAR